MNKFIAIETSNEGLFLEVELGLICNYKCSYCPPYSYTGDMWIDYDKLIEFIYKVNPLQILLVGGEPTLYPTIDQLLYELKNKIVNMTSNGNKPLSWWETHLKYIDVLTLSYHIERASLESFINKLKFISDHKAITVNIPMMVDRFDECLEAGIKMSKIKNIYVSLKALINKNKVYDNYSDNQLEIMSNILKPKVETIFNKHHIRFYGKTEDGKLEKLRCQAIISNKDNVYKGWKCWKGIQRMKLSSDGSIYKASCDSGTEKFFGNIHNDEVNFPTEPEVCQKDYCNCLPDLKTIKKEKI